MAKVNPAKLVSEVVGQLNPRLKDVIAKRYGLKDGQRRTLEAIGKEFGITRERVRQIEAEAFRQLKDRETFSKLEAAFQVLRNHLESHGRLRKEETLLEADLEKHLGLPDSPEQKAAVRFLLVLADKHFHRIPESKHYHTFWTIEPELVGALPKIVSSLEEYFKKRTSVAQFSDVKIATEQALAKHLGGSVTPKAVQAYLGVAKPIGRNVFGNFGLANWPEISPRGIKDKAYLVLKKEAKPLHFKDVADVITKSGFSKKKAHVQTVHNELIKDKRFILVGRGTYALKEWGYQPGTVRDVLLGLLKAAGRPMSKEEIVAQILKQRQVKANTILLNLQDRDYFSKTSNGLFTTKA